MARWFAMSTGFLSDPKVERLIDRHGTDAVAVTVALMAQAMRQERRGEVELTYRTLGNESHTSRDVAVDVLMSANEVGFLVIDRDDDYEFTAHFPAWEKHQQNHRQQKSRAKKGGDVTDCHADVTHPSPTDKTDKTRKATSSGKPPTEVRQVFDAWVAATGKDPSRVQFSADRKRLIASRLKSWPLADLLDAVRGWKHSPHHRGENPSGKEYNSLSLLLRNTEKIEEFRDLERAATRKRRPSPQELP